jgi:hypothetical protein
MILLFFLTGKFPLFQSNDDVEALMEIATIIGRKQMERTATLHSMFIMALSAYDVTDLSSRSTFRFKCTCGAGGWYAMARVRHEAEPRVVHAERARSSLLPIQYTILQLVLARRSGEIAESTTIFLTYLSVRQDITHDISRLRPNDDCIIVNTNNSTPANIP